MVEILLQNLPKNIASALAEKLDEYENGGIHYHPERDLMPDFETVVPELIMLGYYHDNSFFDLVDKILSFDGTVCIFVLVESSDEYDRDMLYKAGVRVIMPIPTEESIDVFLETLYSSCNDLEHGKCIECWKQGRFDVIETLM